MPANNSKVMSSKILRQLNEKYIVKYDDVEDKIVVTLSTCKRITVHDSNKPFHINAKKIRKVCFNMTVIDIWKELTKEKKYALYTIFDVQNAATLLKVLYQPITKQKILEQLKHKFEGIKKV